MTRARRAAGPQAPHAERPLVVYYDDSCGFCERCRQVLARADRGGNLTFIGSNDRAAHRHDLDAFYLDKTLVVFDGATGAVFTRARAAAAICAALPVPWPSLRFIAWPGLVWVANRAYDLVARNRHRISRRLGMQACVVPGQRPNGAPPAS